MAVLFAGESAALAARGSYEVPNSSYAPPTSYYNAATGTGDVLKASLRTIISAGFVSRSYGDARYAFALMDQDPANSSNILLAYNDASVSSTWDGGITYNREHQWPKYWLGLTSSTVSNSYKGIASDLFELRPCSESVNSSRSDDGYGGTSNGAGTGYGVSGAYWYPGDIDAGEVARSMFYMATLYTNGYVDAHGLSYNLYLVNGTPSRNTTTHEYYLGDLASLLKWNYQHGVDNFERRRNQYVYSSALNPTYYQGNRNPFIDHPEYVWAIFGGGNNNSQIYVGSSPKADGSSSTSVSLGRVMLSGTLSSSVVVMNKTGVDPTTFSITPGSDGVCAQSGVGQCVDYNNQSLSLTVGLASTCTSTAGLKTGTVAIANTDLTSGGAGQGAADGNDTINISAAVLANRLVTADSADFGVVHVGAVLSSPITLRSASGDDNQATRVRVGNAAPDGNGFSVRGGGNPLFNSSSVTDVRTLAALATTAGTFGGAVTLTTSGEGLAGENPVNVHVAYRVQVFSGSGTWTGGSAARWSDAHNWIDQNGVAAAPGTFGESYNGSDAAIFGGAAEPATIDLTGVVPNLRALSFGGGDYTLTGSTLALTGSDGDSVVAVAAGTQRIASTLDVTGRLVKTGSGTLILSGSRADIGGVFLNAGTLVFDGAASLADGASLTVGDSSAFTLPIKGDVQATPGRLPSEAVPEPATWMLLTVGICAAVAARHGWRRRPAAVLCADTNEAFSAPIIQA